MKSLINVLCGIALLAFVNVSFANEPAAPAGTETAPAAAEAHPKTAKKAPKKGAKKEHKEEHKHEGAEAHPAGEHPAGN